MPFPELPEGQTHYENDGCGEPAHNVITPEKLKDAVRFSNFAQWFKMGVWQRIESHRISETALDEIAELVWERFEHTIEQARAEARATDLRTVEEFTSTDYHGRIVIKAIAEAIRSLDIKP